MNRFLIISFTYMHTTQYCLARFRKGPDYNEYAITIMNGELEGLFFGQHFFLEKDGCLYIEPAGTEVQQTLKESIGAALGEMLNMPVQRAAMPKQREM